MSTETAPSTDCITRMYQAAEKAAKGVRDPEGMRKACESMDRIGEDVRRRHGVLNFGTPAINDLRDQ